MPELDQRVVPGRLTLRGEFGPELDVDSLLGPEDDPFPSVVHGFLGDGTPVTFLEFGGLVTEDDGSGLYHFHWAIIGRHLGDTRERAFKSLDVELSHLGSWLLEPSEPILAEDEVRIPLGQSAPLSLFQGEGTATELRITYRHGPHRAEDVRGWELTAHPYLRLELESQRPFEALVSMVEPYISLLRLAVLKPVKMLRLVFDGDVEVHGDRLQEASGERFREATRPLLTPADMSLELVSRWLDQYDQIEPALDLFGVGFFSRTMNRREQFLVYTLALERLHRALFPTSEREKATYFSKVDRILECAPENQRSWLQERLRFGYEPSLKKRVSELLHLVSGDLELSGPVHKTFPFKVSRTRNFLVHGDPGDRKGIIEPSEYWTFSMAMRVLIEGVLLQQLRIGDYPDHLRRAWEYSWLQFAGLYRRT